MVQFQHSVSFILTAIALAPVGALPLPANTDDDHAFNAW
jgi:hypothetical protein